MEYRRARTPGGCYFFTLVAHDRRPLFADTRIRGVLGNVMRQVRRRHPFRMDAIVVLPDHLHCIWTLPEGDGDFPMRWALIKREVTRLAAPGRVWQKRFCEHLIRDEADFRRHVEYIHYNPVRHDLVQAPAEWPWSSFHRYVAEGRYPADWGGAPPAVPDHVGRE